MLGVLWEGKCIGSRDPYGGVLASLKVGKKLYREVNAGIHLRFKGYQQLWEPEMDHEPVVKSFLHGCTSWHLMPRRWIQSSKNFRTVEKLVWLILGRRVTIYLRSNWGCNVRIQLVLYFLSLQYDTYFVLDPSDLLLIFRTVSWKSWPPLVYLEASKNGGAMRRNARLREFSSTFVAEVL